MHAEVLPPKCALKIDSGDFQSLFSCFTPLVYTFPNEILNMNCSCRMVSFLLYIILKFVSQREI